MDDVGETAAPSYYGWPAEIAPVIGAAAAVIVAALYGPPLHARITLLVMMLLTGFGVTLGFHRLFAHRSFATFRPVECTLMILGCMGGGAPFFWVATHRAHHRHSDRDGDHTRPTSGLGTGSGCYGESGMHTSSGCTRMDIPTNCRRLGI
jgi:stearoyl-CoA desaturase (delta-9 desaturase)